MAWTNNKPSNFVGTSCSTVSPCLTLLCWQIFRFNHLKTAFRLGLAVCAWTHYCHGWFACSVRVRFAPAASRVLVVWAPNLCRVPFPRSESVNNAGNKNERKYGEHRTFKKLFGACKNSERSAPRGNVAVKLENEARPVFRNLRLMVGCQQGDQFLVQHPDI